MPPKKEPVISAFERKRLENIANNNAILSEITTTADKIIPKPAPLKPKRPSASRVKREPVKREPLRPTRQSSRLAGLDADAGVLKRKAEVEAEVEAEKAKAKKQRVNGDLNLGDIQVDGRKWEAGLEGLAGLKGLVRGAQPGVRTFTDDDVKETTDKGLKDLRLRMGGLELYEKWPVQGTMHPSHPGFKRPVLTLDRHQNRPATHLLNGLPPHGIQAHHICRRQGGRNGRV